MNFKIKGKFLKNTLLLITAVFAFSLNAYADSWDNEPSHETSFTDTISNTCSPQDEIPLHLSADTDAHVEKNTQSYYTTNACLSASSGTISCYYVTGSGNGQDLCTTGQGYDTCLATISGDTDAHVSDCVTGTPYGRYICCEVV